MANELILIIEDNEKNRRLARDVLQFTGYRTIESETAEEGIRLAHEQKPALILMDFHLPGMNGIEFLDHCRRERVFQDIPVLLTGTQGREEDTMKGLKAGARGYLTKPFQSENLYKVIDKIFNRAVRAQQNVMECSL